MREYYLKQVEFVPEMHKLAEKIQFHPKANRQILVDWLNSITIDWPISRRRYYATEIPIWYCMNCGEPHVPKPGKYYRPWLDPSPFKKCRVCGSEEFSGENRTFDTWMDSSVSALFITRYGRDRRFFKRMYPTAIRPQGKDIVRTWLYYSLLRCYQITGREPWTHAWVSGYGVDEKGERMSKSRGNVIDPDPILEKYGGDAFRFWNASEATLGSDFRCSESRVAGAKKFLTKLWNVSRFISSFPQPRTAKLMTSDRWILGELSALIERCRQGYDEYNFFVPASETRDFLWENFASHYLEMVKPRTYGQGFDKTAQQAAWYTLHEVLKTLLLLAAPIIPHITDAIWRELYGKKSIHNELFPTPKWNKQLTKLTPNLVQFNRQIWKRKEERNLALRDSIKATIPKNLKPFARDLMRMHYIAKK
jgi:valyl-tRNA synthetase